MNGYPGAIESEHKSERVKGELYRVINQKPLFSALDDYEECSAAYPQPHEYIRKKLLISALDGGVVSAWVYVFNHDVSDLSVIQSGDYLRYLSTVNAE